MRIEIYRIRPVFNQTAIDDFPETVVDNVRDIVIGKNVIKGIDFNNRTFSFSIDHLNYKYFIRN